MRTRVRKGPLLLSIIASAMLAGAGAYAQDDPEDTGDIDELLSKLSQAQAGEGGSQDELAAWRLVQEERLIKAREVAEKVVAGNPRSYIGHFVLGWVQHYGEANFPKALYHHERALSLYEEHHGDRPGPEAPWRWHSRVLREVAQTHGDLEHYVEQVELLREHNEMYQPRLIAERAWPLMKMGKYDEARLAAEEGLASGDLRQEEIGLNALCAIEFEAGNDGESYDACKMALDHARAQGSVNTVDLTNFAEASRSMFKLGEAERILLEATEANVAWYGNPWMELGALYTREGRFAEALEALKKVPGYRAQRPPHVRNADRNETRRTLATFLLAVGEANAARRITDQALVMPDRRSHQSRDPAQDRAVVALIDRRARRVLAERKLEQAAGKAVHQRAWAWAEASWLRFEGWMSGRQAARLLADDHRFVGTFRIGTAESAIMPPWVAGELVSVAGPGVVRAALDRARAKEARDDAGAYYEAFEAEAALESGDDRRAVELATRALAGLGKAEVMLRARTHAVAAEAERRLGRYDRAATHYDAAFQKDPGVLRRLDLELPVRVSAKGDAVAEAVADALGESPRFDVGAHGLSIAVSADATGGRACLVGKGGAQLGCGRAQPDAQDDADRLARRIVASLHEQAFAPRVDLGQADINSLDGSNRVSRDPLETMFDEAEPFDEPGLEGGGEGEGGGSGE